MGPGKFAMSCENLRLIRFAPLERIAVISDFAPSKNPFLRSFCTARPITPTYNVLHSPATISNIDANDPNIHKYWYLSERSLNFLHILFK